MIKTLYRFSESFGRMGDIESIFISDPETIKKAVGMQYYFGDVLGKHSDVGGTLDAESIEEITSDPAVIKVIEALQLEAGPNPLDSISVDCDVEGCEKYIEEYFNPYGKKQIQSCENCDCPHKEKV